MVMMAMVSQRIHRFHASTAPHVVKDCFLHWMNQKFEYQYRRFARASCAFYTLLRTTRPAKYAEKSFPLLQTYI
jgi:hypothetical protein